MRRLTDGKASRERAAELYARLKKTRKVILDEEALVMAHTQRYVAARAPGDEGVSGTPQGQQSRSRRKKPWK